jgi:hypothetical protein
MNKKIDKLKNSRLKASQLILIWYATLPIISAVLFIMTIYFNCWHIYLAYIIYIFFDSKSKIGSKTSNLYRNNFIFNIVRDYFDMKIIKTCDIPATKNYLFCYHPHGVFPFGMVFGLNSNCCEFDNMYPNINVNLKVHSVFLTFPLLRELCLYFGAQSASRESVINTLNKPGNSVGLSIGGGAEVIYGTPNTAKLIIKNRLGFVRIALETG